MTIGTAIVISIAIICVTFIITCLIGFQLKKRQSESTDIIKNALNEEILHRIKNRHKTE